MAKKVEPRSVGEHLTHVGIVLRATPLRDSDLMLTILCDSIGTISAVAKGARSSKKRFLGGLDLFDCGRFEIAPLRGDRTLYALHALDERRVWPGMRERLYTFTFAALCVEITTHFAPEGDTEGAVHFRTLYKTLKALAACEQKDISAIISILCILLVVKDAGYDPVHSDIEIAPEIRSWWEQMQLSGKPLQPPNQNAPSVSLAALTRYIEELLHYRLRTQVSV